MYFVVAMMADVDPMYQYSLKYFNQVRTREELKKLESTNFVTLLWAHVMLHVNISDC